MSDKVPFDKVVLSCDENPIFVPFASLVAKAWGKFFPEVQVELAFVTKNLEDSRYKDMMNAILKPKLTDKERIELKKQSVMQNALGGGNFGKLERI